MTLSLRFYYSLFFLKIAIALTYFTCQFQPSFQVSIKHILLYFSSHFPFLTFYVWSLCNILFRPSIGMACNVPTQWLDQMIWIVSFWSYEHCSNRLRTYTLPCGLCKDANQMIHFDTQLVWIQHDEIVLLTGKPFCEGNILGFVDVLYLLKPHTIDSPLHFPRVNGYSRYHWWVHILNEFSFWLYWMRNQFVWRCFPECTLVSMGNNHFHHPVSYQENRLFATKLVEFHGAWCLWNGSNTDRFLCHVK